jgi:hypothetical protein
LIHAGAGTGYKPKSFICIVREEPSIFEILIRFKLRLIDLRKEISTGFLLQQLFSNVPICEHMLLKFEKGIA